MKIENVYMTFGDTQIECIAVTNVDDVLYVVGCVEDLGNCMEWASLDGAMPYNEFVEFVEEYILSDYIACKPSEDYEDAEEFFLK